MKKEDLKSGNVVELRDGSKYIQTCIEEYGFIILDYISATSPVSLPLNKFNDDLKGSHSGLDIMKVYEDYTLKKVLWERKEFVVSTDEKTILRIIPKTFKWIVRSQERCLLLYEEKPQKTRYFWESSLGNVESLMVFNHLFEYIKWEDELPTLIEDLLKN